MTPYPYTEATHEDEDLIRELHAEDIALLEQRLADEWRMDQAQLRKETT